MNRKMLRFYFLAIAIFSFFNLSAQSYYFKHFGVSNGLPFNHVYAIAQTQDGYLWFGGYGGLANYNGYDVKTFSQKDSLPSVWVNELCTTKDILWGGTQNGMFYKSSNGSFVNITHSGINEKSVNFIKAGYAVNSVWVGVEKSLFYLSFENDSLTIQDYSDLLNERVVDVISFSSDSIYIAGAKQLMFFDGHAIHDIDWWPYRDLVINKVLSFDDHLIVATRRGVLVKSKDEVKGFNKNNGLFYNNIRDIVQVSEDRYWLATGIGVIEMYQGNFELVTVSTNPNGNDIRDLFKDREGNIWVGTINGMYQYSGSQFRSFSFKDGLSNNNIFGITQLGNGNMLLASDGSGLIEYDGRNFINHTELINRLGITVTAFTTKDNQMYIGAQGGLFQMDGNSFNSLVVYDSLKNIDISALYTDKNGNVWFGGDGKIGYLNDDTFKLIVDSKNLDFQAWAFAETQRGQIIIGTYEGGVLQYENGVLSNYLSFDTLLTDNILSILVDENDNVILGTFNGVFILDKERNVIGRLNDQNGLNSNFIYNMVFDDEDNLWIGTNKGVNKFDYKSFLKNGFYQVQRFGLSEGFVGVENNCNGAYCDHSGRLWFGTVGGLMLYQQGEVLKNRAEPKSVINNIKLFYQDTVFTQNPVLNYDENHLTFGYTGMNLTNPENTQYTYRLNGFDSDWAPVTKERVAAYPNLPPGKYQFEVKSTNAQGIWSKEPEVFAFEIQKPIWMTTWFVSLCIVLFLGSISIVVLVLNRRVRSKELIRRQMNELKLQSLRSQMNPHFLFNSLNSIQHYINNNEKRSANRYLTKFATLMRFILEQSRKQYIKVDEEVNWLNLYLELESMRFEGRFDYEFYRSDEVRRINPKLPPMMLQPFIENALLHGFVDLPFKGHIYIGIEIKGDQLRCTIEDNGIGLEQSQEKKSRQSGHNSAGMKITDNRIQTLQKHLNAKIRVLVKKNQPNSQYPGTTVEIYLPLIE